MAPRNSNSPVSLAVAVWALSACAVRAPLSPDHAAVSSPRAHLSDVPFFPDNTDKCGPSSLASVISFWGVPVSTIQLRSEVYMATLRGTLPLDLPAAVRSRGLAARVLNGSIDDIKGELRQGRPVIAYLDFGTRRHPIGHFLVVTGFDDARRGFYVHSSLNRDKFATYRRFERGWRDTDRWMMAVARQESELPPERADPAPPSRLRLALSAEEYVRLGQAYDRLGRKNESRAAYLSGLEVDKNYSPGLSAAGRAAFEAGNYDEAARFFERLVKRDPESGVANNNLAMAYARSGRHLARAEKHARRAIKAGYGAYAYDTLANVLMAQGKLTDARAAVEDAKKAAAGNADLLSEILETEKRLQSATESESDIS